MGAIHGKDRFPCHRCHRGFSWRLDLAQHLQCCQNYATQKKLKSPTTTTTTTTTQEYFLLESCLLCGCQLSGLQAEEASFVKGLQKLYGSKKPLTEVLQIITRDASVEALNQHTFGLCKQCMTKINKWDEMNQQLATLAKSLRSVYRLKRSQKHLLKIMDAKIPKQTNNAADDSSESGSDGNDVDNYHTDDNNSMDTLENTSITTTTSTTTTVVKQESTLTDNNLSEDKTLLDCDNKEYKCDCGQTVRGLNVFVEHQLREGCKIKTNEFPCKFCESVFSEKKLLIAHKKACVESSLINGAHECDICGRRFLVRGRVVSHKRLVHSIGTADQQLCSYCGRTFGSGYNMKNHLAREHGIGQIEVVVCELCGGKFSDRSSLRNHVRNIHGERKHECETCGKRFATPGLLNHHINEMHNNTYNYECNECGEQFHVSFKYRYHMRKKHHKSQFACDDCGRKFIMRSDLYRHVRGVHMGIRDPKRYPCRVCGRLFPSKYKVKRHMSSHGILTSKADRNILTEQHMSGSEGANITQQQQQQQHQQQQDNISSRLAHQVTSDNTDGTSIDVHQLPGPEIYSGPHITTLTPEILQSGLGPHMVAAAATATTDTMVVGSMSSIVVSASPIVNTITSELHQQHHHPPPPTTTTTTTHEPQQQQQQHQQQQHSGFDQDNSLMQQQSVASSLIPVQQMIVIQDSVTVPGHTTTQFSISPPSTSSQSISGPQVTSQVISTSPSDGQEMSVPSVTNQVISGTLHHAPPSNFTVSIPHNPSQHSNHKLPTIHYQYFPS
ncbi:hypothetical protein Pmani_018276 [Petrolisthes manimaculis]|uniref:C2H2-type domain-containing protein n=1 Tax=Petrolisthes manimaculis TaxID=1843537 RepID=A0AAE1PN18_9EUCA|nr:hypothetical protein Pmani_018276 [Petrolisthes manimaculis]